MWKNRARQATYDNIIRHMRFECWIIKATNTDTEYVILIAFPRQQWFRERDIESLGNSRETLISMFILWLEILAQGLLNVGQAFYLFGATFDELKLPCRYYSMCVCVCVRARARARVCACRDHERYSKKFVRFHCGWIYASIGNGNLCRTANVHRL